MSIIKTEAFVTKNFNYGDTSKIVTLFTKDHGKMNCIVKGVRTFKSKYCGVFDSMNYINAVIYIKQNRDLQNISSAEYIRSFKNISGDLDKLNSAYMIIESLSKSSSEGDAAPLLFDLLYDTFLALDNSKKNPLIYLLYFLFHLARINGYSPEIFSPNGEHETFKFESKFKLNGKIIDALNFISRNNVRNIENYFIDDDSLNMIRNYLEDHIADNTDQKRFYKTKKVFYEIKLS